MTHFRFSCSSFTSLDVQGPVSYLDEVPFKLNEKFRCPSKVGLPIGFCLSDCNAILSDLQVSQISL